MPAFGRLQPLRDIAHYSRLAILGRGQEITPISATIGLIVVLVALGFNGYFPMQKVLFIYKSMS